MTRTLSFLALFGITSLYVLSAHAANDEPSVAKQQRAVSAYGQLPMSFTANQGQWGPDVAYRTQSGGFSLELKKHSAELTVVRQAQHAAGDAPFRVQPAERAVKATEDVHMRFLNASDNVTISGADELPGKANFLIGNDASKWRTGVSTYAKVKYANLYPGVDLVYYGNQRRLEFDFIVKPGTDYRTVTLGFEGKVQGKQANLRINKQGDLLIGTNNERMVLPKPVVYQLADGPSAPAAKHVIDAAYVLTKDHEVSFYVGAYDKSKPLVIDPTVVYSSVFGNDHTSASGIAVDAAGNTYITGSTQGPGFPTTRGVVQPSGLASTYYAFISKLNAAGTALIYSTYLGGNSNGSSTGASSIAIDAAGDAFIAGGTNSSNFPTTAGAFQTSGLYASGSTGFVSKLNPTGTSLIYSTLLGGATTGQYEGTNAYGIEIDSAGDAYAAGLTNSLTFPTTPGAYQTTPGPYTGSFLSVFMTKINSTGSALVYSTYLPGTQTAPSLAVDQTGAAYLTGVITNKLYFPITPGAAATSGTAYVTKFNPAGSALDYSTYLQGHHIAPHAIAVDQTGSAYITGNLGVLCNNNLRDESFLCTGDSNLPGDIRLTPGAYETTEDGFGSFIMKLNPAGSKLAYSTYLGDPDNSPKTTGGFPYQYFDYTAAGKAIAVDNQGKAYVAGVTNSPNFPFTSTAFQATFQGQSDAFFFELDPTGSSSPYSTFLGGDGSLLTGGGSSEAAAIALDSSGHVYVAGATSSPSTFPTTPGAYQHFGSGSFISDAFITKFSPPAAGTTSQSITFGFLANEIYGAAPLSLTATSSSGLPVTYRVTGPVTVQGSKLVITGIGSATVTALQEGDATYAAATPIFRSFTVNYALLEVTADNLTRNVGLPNPPLTYTVTGFVNGDSTSVVHGSATLTTSATAASVPGTYPITFAIPNLHALNYLFVYVPGTLTVASQPCSPINTYANGFTSAGLSLNHGATIKGNLLQLTDGGLFEARSAFYETPVSLTNFATDFTFQLLDPNADGFTFTLQSNNAQIYGRSGGSLGYKGIPKSAAVKFDLHNNVGEGNDSLGFFQNGADPTIPDVDLTSSGVDLHSGHVFHVHITYVNAKTAVTITDTQTSASATVTFPADLSTSIGAAAYAGFTAGTGEGTATQNILTWSFAGGPGCSVASSAK